MHHINNDKLPISSPFELFAQQVAANPHSIAITDSDQAISYSALKKSVDNLSLKLIQDYLLKKNDIIAIALPPSIEFVSLTLACLKCGITYIPLNLNYPDAYLEKILTDSKPKLVITEQPHLNRRAFFQQQTISLTQQRGDCDTATVSQSFDNPDNHDNSYIIYTSGSTGTPKGVMIKNANIINLMQSTKEIFQINCQDKIPLFHSVAFDFSIWEIYSAIFNGATLVIPGKTDKFPIANYINFIKDNNISMLNLTPSIFYLLSTLIEKNNLNIPSLKRIILGGESFIPQKADKWFEADISKQVTLYNMYGITEGTIHFTVAKITSQFRHSNDSYIGNALSGNELGILDKSNKLSFEDNEGELCISGHGLARGYLNDNKLNSDKFFISQDRLWFKTGDWVKKHNSQLFYLNRIDNIIKIRGFRINCVEIESLILNITGVSNVLVKAYQINKDDTRLAVFIENSKKNIELLEIKNTIKANLPDFMMPTKFIILENFPLTENGKIDTNELNKELENNFSNTNKIAADEQPIETIIINTWKELLRIDHINIDENFFDAGGDSLLLIKLQYLLSVNLNANIKITDLIRYPSINSFMKYWNSTNNDEKIAY